jgi:hypothetical protein
MYSSESSYRAALLLDFEFGLTGNKGPHLTLNGFSGAKNDARRRETSVHARALVGDLSQHAALGGREARVQSAAKDEVGSRRFNKVVEFGMVGVTNGQSYKLIQSCVTCLNGTCALFLFSIFSIGQIFVRR